MEVIKSLRTHHLIRFSLVGALGFFINFLLLTILYKLIGLPLFISQLIAGEVALFNNFLLHHHWTYKGHNVTKSLFTLFMQFHATSWAAIIGTALVVSFGVAYLHLHYLVALLLGGVIAMGWNFGWSKFVIWRHHNKEPA